MNTTVSRGALVLLVMLSAACGSSVPTSPTETSQPESLPAPTPPPPTSSPASSGPSRTFSFDRELSYRVSDYTRQSRFLLSDDGAFVLEFVGLKLEYRGRYSEANGVIAFVWEGWSSAGPWGATGTLDGNSLTVQYNLIMQMTDFEDAVYVMP